MDNFETAKSILRRFEQRPKASDSLHLLAQKYGIEISTDWKLKDVDVTLEKIGHYQLRIAFDLLNSELNIYSVGLIKASGLKRIILCSKVSTDGSTIGGALRGESGTLFWPLNWNTDLLYSRHTFHHELYHCIDYYDTLCHYWDPDWEKLNEKSFSYSHQEQSHQQNEIVHRIGFVSNYAMTTVQDDKAELYAHMILNYNFVCSRSEHDPILKNKFWRLKELLHQFCPEFDEAFWTSREKCSTPIWDDESDVVTLRIWSEQVGGSKIWLVVRQDIPPNKPVAFYSDSRLNAFLNALGLDDFQEINKLRCGERMVEVNVRAPHSVLSLAGLA